MKTHINDKNIVLGVCGGIAAYKSVELLRLLKKQGASVRVIMTQNARAFVGPVTFEALSGQAVCTGLFEKGADASIRHIDWAQASDAVVIAPATANIIAKIAQGIADDLLSTTVVGADCPVMLAPAMNTRMWNNPILQGNLQALRQAGYAVIEPGTGWQACRVVGPGRMAEPEQVLAEIRARLKSAAPRQSP